MNLTGPPLPPSPPPDRDYRNSFLRGFGLVMLFHLVQLPLIAVTIMLALATVGVVQLAYVIPLALKARQRHETSRLQGILTAAGLTFLLNGICDANLLYNFKPH